MRSGAVLVEGSRDDGGADVAEIAAKRSRLEAKHVPSFPVSPHVARVTTATATLLTIGADASGQYGAFGALAPHSRGVLAATVEVLP